MIITHLNIINYYILHIESIQHETCICQVHFAHKYNIDRKHTDHRSPTINGFLLRLRFEILLLYISWQTAGKCVAFEAERMLNVRCSIMVKLR